MKALIAHRLVGIDALASDEIAAPTPGTGQVLIAVGAAGLHLTDLAALAGDRHPRPALPFIPGLEAAGLVAAVGEGVSDLTAGDRVVTFLDWGGLAEGAIAKAALCAKLPDGMAFSTAAGLPVAYGGALLALRDRASLAVGETLLVMGAGGQAGLAAVEIGKRLGARVIAVVGGAARGSEASELGADDIVDAASRPLSESVSALTGAKGVDVIFDPVGGDAFEIALMTLARGGRMISAGFAAGRIPRVNVGALFARNAALIAANIPFAVQDNPVAAQAALNDVIAWTADGSLRPRVAAQFPLGDVRPAFDYIKARRGAGAVIVTIGQDSGR